MELLENVGLVQSNGWVYSQEESNKPFRFPGLQTRKNICELGIGTHVPVALFLNADVLVLEASWKTAFGFTWRP